MLRRLILLFIVFFLSVFASQNTPFCDICDCGNNRELPDIKCDKINKNKLFDNSSWIYVTNTTSNIYNMLSLTVQNSNIIALDKTFPNSTIKLLNLANNSIVNISENVFQNLQDMEVLILSDNNIELLDPKAFNGLYLEGDFQPLKSLKVLKLDHNKIHSLDQDLFEHMSRIVDLFLDHNPIKVIDHHTHIAITGLVYLKTLDLSYTQLSTLPADFLHTPKHLEFFDLSGNNFTAVPQTLQQAHNLETFYFNDNPIEKLTNETGFPLVTTLKVLRMTYMPKLTSIDKNSLSNLINLEELYLNNNIDLSYIDKDALSSKKNGAAYETWPPLAKVHLENNKLTTIDRHLILSWEKLVELDLTSNAWTCECENQWMIDELIPIYLGIDEFGAKEMRCAAPVEMAEFTLYDLHEKQTFMRCLDSYGNRPEKDAALLVGMLAGVLLAVPLILFIIYAYQRHWFGLFDKSAASYSRQFYKRTNLDENL